MWKKREKRGATPPVPALPKVASKKNRVEDLFNEASL